MAKVFVKDRKARPFWFGHPWVFSGAVDRVKGRVRDGDVVELCDAKGRLIGQGFFNSRSQIRVRLVALEREGPVDEKLLLKRLERAVDLRRRVLAVEEDTNAWRVVHSEADGLPGLVVDRIGDWLVIQVSALGMLPFLNPLLDRLEELLAPRGILERVSTVAVEEEGLERPGGTVRGEGPTGAVEVVERGVKYLCDLREGQKTGFYADQRENRFALSRLARGRAVLDAFSYVAGFGLRMAVEGAASLHLLDSSESALEFARAGAGLNGVEDKVTVEKGNVLRVLDHMRKERKSFDVVVVDPPKLVKKRADLKRGLRLYHEINTKAVAVVRDGGTLVTCSCSQHVLDEDLDELLGSVAAESAVRLQEIYRGGQAPDHPVLIPLDESRYLKCRALRIWREGQPATLVVP